MLGNRSALAALLAERDTANRRLAGAAIRTQCSSGANSLVPLIWAPLLSGGYPLRRLLSQFHLPLGMNPGTPVSTTALNLMRDLIPSVISRMAPSGMVET